jgi:acyl-CoA thioesterase-1
LRALKSLLLFAAIIMAPLSASAQVVCLGASNTAGKGFALRDAYPAQLEAMLQAKGYTGRVANAGISGDTTAGMLARLDAAVPQGTRVVILQPGGNDARRGIVAQRNDNISQIVERLKARQIAVVMLENAMLGAGPGQFHQSDGEHLTPEGYRLIAAQLLPQVAHALALPVSRLLPMRLPVYSTSAGSCGSMSGTPGASGTGFSWKVKASLSSSSSRLTRTMPPFARCPNSSSSASGFLMCS